MCEIKKWESRRRIKSKKAINLWDGEVLLHETKIEGKNEMQFQNIKKKKCWQLIELHKEQIKKSRFQRAEGIGKGEEEEAKICQIITKVAENN